MKNHTPPDLTLITADQDLPFYTTLLQSGIEIKGRNGETVAGFLDRLPGFTLDYIADTVQTIFLDGTANDDLTTPLAGKTPTLALSAAMPGLAGAIFRRNSFHAGLRTRTSTKAQKTGADEPLTVTLKLFNSIATEKGPGLLRKGVTLQSDRLLKFLAPREGLTGRIKGISLADHTIAAGNLAASLARIETINLKIISSHG
ncbi:MAG: hypothetical protein JRJ68_07825 [Deltaproteobacteria bacterium]|nr:hypothetical protein [Deltaproteobacteria bacterium]